MVEGKQETIKEWGIFYPIDVQALKDETVFGRPILDVLRSCNEVRQETEHTWYLSAFCVEERLTVADYLQEVNALGDTPYRITYHITIEPVEGSECK